MMSPDLPKDHAAFEAAWPLPCPAYKKPILVLRSDGSWCCKDCGKELGAGGFKNRPAHICEKDLATWEDEA